MPNLALTVLAVLVLSLPASAAQPVTADKVEELRQLAIAAEKRAAPAPAPEMTAEQEAARERSIRSHCEAFFARATERGAGASGECQ